MERFNEKRQYGGHPNPLSGGTSMSNTSPTAQTDTETLTRPDAIPDALDTLAVGNVVGVNGQDPQRVTDIAPMAVSVAGSWSRCLTNCTRTSGETVRS